MGKTKTTSTTTQKPLANPAQPAIDTAKTAYEETKTPSALENQFSGVTSGFQKAYENALNQNTQDYGNIMSAYGDFRKNSTGPTSFSFQPVSAERPAELNEGYGYLREAMPGYRDFASTGGYSDKDVQELRARGISPIRAAYGNTIRELDRARAIGGNGGSPNYIAARSRAQRELPEQIANATTNVNAGLADAIRQGKMFGLSGITNTGNIFGNLSSAEAGRMLQAALANQSADLQAQGMTESSKQANRGMDLSAINAMAGLYGTTPGMASTFGNQALNAWQTGAGLQNARNQMGLNLIDQQLRGYGMTPYETTQTQTQSKPWWQTALNIAGTVAPFALAPFTGGTSLLGSKMLPGGGMTSLAPSLSSGFRS